MAINALFYTFSKRRNSTVQPSTGAVPAAIELKEETDIINPVILLYGIPNPYVLNYCYIAEFSRYYWVTNWRWENSRWSASLRVDVLASYKTAIGASSQYILRCSAAYDGNIKDTLYPITSLTTRASHRLGTSGRATTLQDGCYILGIISSLSSVGAVAYYQLTAAQMQSFVDALMVQVTWSTGVTEISLELQKELFNPFQYVVSCIWVPYTAGNWESVTEIKLGFWTFTCNAMKLSVATTLPTYNAAIYAIPASDIPLHPQISRGNFLKSEEYSKYYLRLTGYGTIELPNELVLLNQGCTIVESRDLITAESVINIYAGVGNARTTTPLMVIHGRYGVPIQLATSTSDIIGGAVNLYKGISNGVSAALSAPNAVAAAGGLIGGVAAGVADAVMTAMPNIQSGGINGSFLATLEFSDYSSSAINPIDTIEAVFRWIADDDNADLGRPYCNTATLNTKAGYILCGNAHVPISGTDTEQAEVEQFLNTGFFFE